jgi:transposase
MPLGQRPPAPPPPPGWAPTSAAAPAAAEAVNGAEALAPRRHPRHRLDAEPPARIALANHQPVFVTINDISSGGCCVVRKGRLDLANGDIVTLDLWTEQINTRLSIHARVSWCSQQENSSRVGLRFVETDHRLQRQIEAYVHHYRQPVDDSRPQVRIPQHSRTIVEDPLLPQLPVDASVLDPSPAVEPGETRAPQRRGLAAMPRPGRLKSLDQQRRLRPVDRHEVARIAEETGLHINTLYGWLRTLRLEGEVDPERSGDPDTWSATDKFSVLLQVAGLSAAERAAYCHRHGIGEEQLERWRRAALQANEKPMLILRAEEELQRLRLRDQAEIRRLQKELRRRERSSAISEELLQVVRKLQILWEQGDSP